MQKTLPTIIHLLLFESSSHRNGGGHETNAFIKALRCFLAILGRSTLTRSDQGPNFIGTKIMLAAAMKKLDKDIMANCMTKKESTFEFNIPQESHSGGVRERQVRYIRNVLRSTVAFSPTRLDDLSLRTFFYEAMLI